MRINFYLLIYLLIFSTANAQSPAEEPVTAEFPFNNPLVSQLDFRVDSTARSFLARNNTVSISIGIIENGRFHTYGYGETKKGNKTAPDGKTLYEIGSITKTFTGIMLAHFVEKKVMRLDDPVNKYLPDSISPITYNGKPVTLASLSNHSSGLPRLPKNFWDGADQQNPYKHYDNNKLFSFLKSFEPVREPGEQYEYSNLAVGLLGVIMERVSGRTYEQLLKEIVWKPLKMNSSRIKLETTDSVFFAQGYVSGRPVHSWEFVSLAAAGAIRSSIDDLLLYAQAQLSSGNSTLQKAIALSHKETFKARSTRVGLGWHLIEREGRSYLFHNGQTSGYYTVMLVNAVTGNAVIMLTNALVDPMMTAVDLITWMDK